MKKAGLTKIEVCQGCIKLTSDNACRVGALYGMKRCIRTPKPKKESQDPTPDDSIAEEMIQHQLDRY